MIMEFLSLETYCHVISSRKSMTPLKGLSWCFKLRHNKQGPKIFGGQWRHMISPIVKKGIFVVRSLAKILIMVFLQLKIANIAEIQEYLYNNARQKFTI